MKHFQKFVFLSVVLLTLAGCSSSKNVHGKMLSKSAEISYYGDQFNGNKTSSGERFSNNNLTAAHRTLPFGTKLKLTNPKNGKSVIVKVNDRGPQKKSRELDVTKKAFMEIANDKNCGTMKVSIEIVR